jgi:hypothetical protein
MMRDWDLDVKEMVPLNPAHHRLQPTLRMIYTQVALYKLRGGSNQHTDHDLQQRLFTALSAAEEAGSSLAVDMDQVTFNTRTAMSRVGLNVEDDIRRYIVCPQCWNPIDYDKLSAERDSICLTMNLSVYPYRL